MHKGIACVAYFVAGERAARLHVLMSGLALAGVEQGNQWEWNDAHLHVCLNDDGHSAMIADHQDPMMFLFCFFRQHSCRLLNLGREGANGLCVPEQR
jgi:hypothetical protein